MKTYKAIFTSNSNISKLPDAQTIFGAICSIIKFTQGEEVLLNYLDAFDNSPFFIHSSMFVNGFLPMMKENLFSVDLVNQLVSETENIHRLEILQKMKKFKKIQYVSEAVFYDYIADDFSELRNELLNDKSKLQIINNCLLYANENAFKSVQELLIHVKTDHLDIAEGENRDLFYDTNTCFSKDTEFCIFVKSDLPIAYITNIFKYFEFFGVGNRTSVGKNTFKLKSINEIEFKKTVGKKVALSKFIPAKNEVDIKKSSYQIVSSIHRTSYEYLKNCISGKFNQLSEGSFMKLNHDSEYIGKVIKTAINDKEVYHYAIGFMV